MERLDHRPETPSNKSKGGRSDGPNDIPDASKPTKQNRTRLGPEPGTYKKRLRGPLRDLALPGVVKSATSIRSSLVIRHESPWDTFRRSYNCELGKTFEVASPRVHPTRLVAIRTIQKTNINTILRLFETTQHPNILSSWDLFLHEGSIFAVHDYEDIEISLDNLIACEAYLNEIELAAVLAQVSHVLCMLVLDAKFRGRFLMACYISPVVKSNIHNSPQPTS